MERLQAQLDCRFGDFRLRADLALPGSGIGALFGPSGSGKSLLLRILAGVERVPTADIHCAGEPWQRGRHSLPAHRRRIGWLPQAPCLFEHLDVEGNLLYALRRRRGPGPELSDVCAQTGIATLLARRVDGLSGGERQRVSLARALLAAPRWLLLDEPLSALDSRARWEISQLLRRVSRQLALPMLLVTHAADEVERLADYVIPIRDGVCGEPRSLAAAIADPQLGLLEEGGTGAVFDLLPSTEQNDADLLRLDLDGLPLFLPWQAALPSGPLRVRIAARDVTLWRQPPPPSSAQNCLPLRLQSITDEGAARLRVDACTASGRVLHARISCAAQRQLQLQIGEPVYAQFKALALGEA